MDAVTTTLLSNLEARVTARQSAVDSQISSAIDKLDTLLQEVVILQSRLSDAKLLESDGAVVGKINEYGPYLDGIERNIDQSKKALNHLRASVKGLDTVDSTVGDDLRGA